MCENPDANREQKFTSIDCMYVGEYFRIDVYMECDFTKAPAGYYDEEDPDSGSSSEPDGGNTDGGSTDPIDGSNGDDGKEATDGNDGGEGTEPTDGKEDAESPEPGKEGESESEPILP